MFWNQRFEPTITGNSLLSCIVPVSGDICFRAHHKEALWARTPKASRQPTRKDLCRQCVMGVDPGDDNKNRTRIFLKTFIAIALFLI